MGAGACTRCPQEAQQSLNEGIDALQEGQVTAA